MDMNFLLYPPLLLNAFVGLLDLPEFFRGKLGEFLWQSLGSDFIRVVFSHKFTVLLFDFIIRIIRGTAQDGVYLSTSLK